MILDVRLSMVETNNRKCVGREVETISYQQVPILVLGTQLEK
jgi:hypothetical protein